MHCIGSLRHGALCRKRNMMPHLSSQYPLNSMDKGGCQNLFNIADAFFCLKSSLIRDEAVITLCQLHPLQRKNDAREKLSPTPTHHSERCPTAEPTGRHVARIWPREGRRNPGGLLSTEGLLSKGASSLQRASSYLHTYIGPPLFKEPPLYRGPLRYTEESEGP